MSDFDYSSLFIAVQDAVLYPTEAAVLFDCTFNIYLNVLCIIPIAVSDIKYKKTYPFSKVTPTNSLDTQENSHFMYPFHEDFFMNMMTTGNIFPDIKTDYQTLSFINSDYSRTFYINTTIDFYLRITNMERFSITVVEGIYHVDGIAEDWTFDTTSFETDLADRDGSRLEFVVKVTCHNTKIIGACFIFATSSSPVMAPSHTPPIPPIPPVSFP
jgi:hypothetical protein